MNIIEHIKTKFGLTKNSGSKSEEVLPKVEVAPSIFFPDKPFEECVKEASEDKEAKEIFQTLTEEIEKFNIAEGQVCDSDSFIIKKELLNYKNKLEVLTNKLIEKNPNVLFLLDEEYNRNLGMMLAHAGIENITLKILDNPYLGSMQDKEGHNIGMFAASSGLKKATSKALENPIASIQQDQDGRNIGMYAAMEEGLDAETIKALDNKKACVQQDKFGYNIGMLAAMYSKNKELLEKTLENTEAGLQQDKDGKNIGMHLVKNIAHHLALTSYEDVLLKALDNEFACMQQDKDGDNIGILVAFYGYKQATLKALDNLVASNQQNNQGFNIGMAAATKILDDEVDYKSLSNPVASVQQTKEGDNIGMFIAKRFKNSSNGSGKYRDPKLLIYALQNKEASIQQNQYGENIGMYLANNDYVPDYVVSYALKNKEASLQQDKNGRNIGMVAVMSKRSVDLILEAMENEEALMQKDAGSDGILERCETYDRDDVFFEIIKRGLDKKPIFNEFINNVEISGQERLLKGEISGLNFGLEICAEQYRVLPLSSSKEETFSEESEME